MSEGPRTAEKGFANWVGRRESLVDVASRSSAIGLAALLDHTVVPERTEGTELSPVGHWLQFTPTALMSELGPDGHPRLGGLMPPLDLPRRMWAGSRIIFHAPILVGQHLERVTTIESITPKNGSSGRLCFVVLQHDYFADHALALAEQQTIVYREAVAVDTSSISPQRPPRASGPAPDGWDWGEAVQPDEIMLFRFSALTFNSHRIHYDLPYASGVEGYSGLVVHGPLSATLIVDKFLRQRTNSTISSFEFTARSPIFVNEQVHVCGRSSGPGVEDLAVVAPDGQVAVTARIEYR